MLFSLHDAQKPKIYINFAVLQSIRILRLKNKMKHYIITAVAVLAMGLASCNEEKFHVEGTITSAEDSLLYFEQVGIDGLVRLDSTRLSADGNFSFSAERPEAPEFYRLRIAGQSINISIDSTETVRIKADYPTMATGYEVEGSDNCRRIKELALMQIDLQRRAMALDRNTAISPQTARNSLQKLLNAHKEKVTRNYIFKDPKAASSYYALFQAIGDYLIFNPQGNDNDIKVFAAVATAWDTFYPGSLRGENLHNIAIEGMRNERIIAAESANKIDPSKVTTTGLIDIKLNDNQGQPRSLTDLKGKVVLLDFHMYAMKDSPNRILHLRELYNKYHDQGFEIYQISIDGDEHFWKQQTANLPWICVRDADGTNSQRLAIYNITKVPEFFLIDRDNNLVSRSNQIDNLDQAIQKLLQATKGSDQTTK